MKKKFITVGNSWAIIFTKTMLDILDVNPENDFVEIDFDKKILSMQKSKDEIK